MAMDPESDIEAFKQWFDQHEEDMRLRTIHFRDVRRVFKDLFHNNAVPSDVRVATLIRALQGGLESAKLGLFKNMMTREKLLTADELANHRKALRDTRGDIGFISVANALAHFEHPEADAAWEEAAAQLMAGDPEPKNRITLAERLVEYKRCLLYTSPSPRD